MGIIPSHPGRHLIGNCLVPPAHGAVYLQQCGGDGAQGCVFASRDCGSLTASLSALHFVALQKKQKRPGTRPTFWTKCLAGICSRKRPRACTCLLCTEFPPMFTGCSKIHPQKDSLRYSLPYVRRLTFSLPNYYPWCATTTGSGVRTWTGQRRMNCSQFTTSVACHSTSTCGSSLLRTRSGILTSSS